MTQVQKPAGYGEVHAEIVEILEAARRAAARSINSLMTETYWEIGRRIVEYEQAGEERAAYGQALLKRLSADLSARYGRGFSERNLEQMRLFFLAWRLDRNAGSKAEDSISQTLSAQSHNLQKLTRAFPLPWSAYVRLLSVKNDLARSFYETEALRGGWTIRQLDRQIGSQFYERTALSRHKVAMLKKGERAQRGDAVTPKEAIKDPYVLEFLDLKDEYSESELEAAHPPAGGLPAGAGRRLRLHRPPAPPARRRLVAAPAVTERQQCRIRPPSSVLRP